MSKRIMALILSVFFLLAIFNTDIKAEDVKLDDIAGHWAEGYINWTIDSHYFKGYPDGSFKPNKTMTNAEYISVMSNLVGKKLEAEIKYVDVKPTDWFYDDLKTIVALGILENKGNFSPSKPITRDEAFRILADIYNQFADENILNSFIDNANIKNKKEIAALVNIGVINGTDDGKINPQAPITRGEVCKILQKNVSILGTDYSKYHKPEVVSTEKKEEVKETKKDEKIESKNDNDYSGNWNEPYYPSYPSEPDVPTPTPPTPPAPTPVEYTVTVTTDGNGTASANPVKGPRGTEVTLTKNAKPNYEFDKWEVVSGNVVIADDKFYIGTENVEVKATFKEQVVTPPTPPAKTKYQLTLPTGNIVNVENATSDNHYEQGTTITFTVTAPEGKKIAQVTANDTVLTAATDGKYSFTINADTTINVVAENETIPPVCPEEKKVKEEFASAVDAALKQITFEGASVTLNKTTKNALLVITDAEKSINSISNTGAATALKKLVDNNGLKSFKIGDRDEKDLTNKDENTLKSLVFEEMLGALNLESSSNIDVLNDKTLTATVKFTSTQAGCNTEYTDSYSVTFKVPKKCPTDDDVKTEIKTAVNSAINTVVLPSDKLSKTLSDNSISIKIVQDVKLEELQNTGTTVIVQLKKLINDNGLRSVKIGEQTVTLSKDDDDSELVNKIINAYKSLKQVVVNEELDKITDTGEKLTKAAEFGNKGLILFAGKTYNAELQFKPSEVEKYNGCSLSEFKVNYTIGFVDDTCPTPFVLKNEFAKYVGEAIKNFNLPEGITASYDEKNRKATVEIVGTPDLDKIQNSGAMSQLKKLVDEKGLISFTIKGGEEQTLTDKSEQELQSLIIEELIKKYDSKKRTQTITSTVKFKSLKCDDVVEDDYTLEVNVIEKMNAEEGKKYDDVFDDSYNKLMSAANNQANKRKIKNHVLFNITYSQGTCIVNFNKDCLGTTILGTKSTGLATGLVGMLTGTNKGTAPQEDLNRVVIVEKDSNKQVELTKADLDLFKEKECIVFFCTSGGKGMSNAAKKGVPGFSSGTKLSELVGKELTITYEYKKENKVYQKTRNIQFKGDYSDSEN